jgi:hypothetical protein
MALEDQMCVTCVGIAPLVELVLLALACSHLATSVSSKVRVLALEAHVVGELVHRVFHRLHAAHVSNLCTKYDRSWRRV